MSDWTVVGTVKDVNGQDVEVLRNGGGGVKISDPWNDLEFYAEVAVDLGELLDRAAMPGQPAGRPCCGHCDHGDGPGGHDPGDPTAHDGPCPSCQAEAAGHG